MRVRRRLPDPAGPVHVDSHSRLGVAVAVPAGDERGQAVLVVLRLLRRALHARPAPVRDRHQPARQLRRCPVAGEQRRPVVPRRDHGDARPAADGDRHPRRRPVQPLVRAAAQRPEMARAAEPVAAELRPARPHRHLVRGRRELPHPVPGRGGPGPAVRPVAVRRPAPRRRHPPLGAAERRRREPAAAERDHQPGRHRPRADLPDQRVQHQPVQLGQRAQRRPRRLPGRPGCRVPVRRPVLRPLSRPDRRPGHRAARLGRVAADRGGGSHRQPGLVPVLQ